MARHLPGYNYSLPGFYFVTICTWHHRLILGTVKDDQVFLKEPGQIANAVWVTLPRRFAHVRLDEYVFMPNHMHAIVELTEPVATHSGPRTPLWEIVRTFKALTTYQVRHSENKPWFAWQEDFYDIVVRDETALFKIRRYISENPMRWAQDEWYKRW